MSRTGRLCDNLSIWNSFHLKSRLWTIGAIYSPVLLSSDIVDVQTQRDIFRYHFHILSHTHTHTHTHIPAWRCVVFLKEQGGKFDRHYIGMNWGGVRNVLSRSCNWHYNRSYCHSSFRRSLATMGKCFFFCFVFLSIKTPSLSIFHLFPPQSPPWARRGLSLLISGESLEWLVTVTRRPSTDGFWKCSTRLCMSECSVESSAGLGVEQKLVLPPCKLYAKKGSKNTGGSWSLDLNSG